MKILLRLEGAAWAAFFFLALRTNDYWPALMSLGWPGGILLFLLPDLSMLGYLLGRKPGAALYNLFHVYPHPLGLLAVASYFGKPLPAIASLVWIIHIGLDRALGLGLKYPTGFNDTHLGRV